MSAPHRTPIVGGTLRESRGRWVVPEDRRPRLFHLAPIPEVCQMDERLGRVRRCFRPSQWFNTEGPAHPHVIDDEEAFMWVYRSDGEGSWVVGYYAPDGTWFPEGVFTSKEAASSRVNYLNGGHRG